MKTARKAILAALVAGTGALAVAGLDNGITLGEALLCLASTVAGGAGVYGVSPGPLYQAPGRHRLDS